MAEADDPKDVPAEVWLAYERQAKDVMNLWAPDVPALQNAVHAAMIRAWRSGRAVAAEPVAVKPLEWSALPSYGADAEQASGHLPGLYGVFLDEDSAAGWIIAEWAFTPEDFCMTWARILGRFASWDEAKAAAEADYEARVRDALAPA